MRNVVEVQRVAHLFEMLKRPQVDHFSSLTLVMPLHPLFLLVDSKEQGLLFMQRRESKEADRLEPYTQVP